MTIQKLDKKGVVDIRAVMGIVVIMLVLAFVPIIIGNFQSAMPTDDLSTDAQTAYNNTVDMTWDAVNLLNLVIIILPIGLVLGALALGFLGR